MISKYIQYHIIQYYWEYTSLIVKHDCNIKAFVNRKIEDDIGYDRPGIPLKYQFHRLVLIEINRRRFSLALVCKSWFTFISEKLIRLPVFNFTYHSTMLYQNNNRIIRYCDTFQTGFRNDRLTSRIKRLDCDKRNQLCTILEQCTSLRIGYVIQNIYEETAPKLTSSNSQELTLFIDSINHILYNSNNNDNNNRNSNQNNNNNNTVLIDYEKRYRDYKEKTLDQRIIKYETNNNQFSLTKLTLVENYITECLSLFYTILPICWNLKELHIKFKIEELELLKYFIDRLPNLEKLYIDNKYKMDLIYNLPTIPSLKTFKLKGIEEFKRGLLVKFLMRNPSITKYRVFLPLNIDAVSDILETRTHVTEFKIALMIETKTDTDIDYKLIRFHRNVRSLSLYFARYGCRFSEYDFNIPIMHILSPSSNLNVQCLVKLVINGHLPYTIANVLQSLIISMTSLKILKVSTFGYCNTDDRDMYYRFYQSVFNHPTIQYYSVSNMFIDDLNWLYNNIESRYNNDIGGVDQLQRGFIEYYELNPEDIINLVNDLNERSSTWRKYFPMDHGLYFRSTL